MSEEKMIYTTKTKSLFLPPKNEIIDLDYGHKFQPEAIQLNEDLVYRVRDLNTADQMRTLKIIPAFTNYTYLLEHDTHPIMNQLLITEVPGRLAINFGSILGFENMYIINTSPPAKNDKAPSAFINTFGTSLRIKFELEIAEDKSNILRFETPKKYQRKSTLWVP